MKGEATPASNRWVPVLISVGFFFSTGYVIGYLAKDVAFTDHEAALTSGGSSIGVGAQKFSDLQAQKRAKARALLPAGKMWPGGRF